MRKLPLVLLFLICTQLLTAQYKKGLKYYNQSDFFKAIPKLKSAANSNSVDKLDATIKLADCYRNLKDYKNAELYYKKAIDIGKTDPLTHYNYGTVLKNNNH